MLSRLTHAASAPVNLELAQSYLKEGRYHKEVGHPETAFILYEHAKASLVKVADERHVKPLSQVKDALRKAQAPQTPEDQALRDDLAAIYLERGEVLEAMGKLDKAKASYEKAQTWGHVDAPSKLAPATRPSSTFGSIKGAFLSPAASFAIPSLSPSLLSQENPGLDAAQIALKLFAKDVSQPVANYELPEVDDRFTSTAQLAYCLNLLEAAPSSETERLWSQATASNAEERERLHTLTTDLIRAFINDELKDEETVAEILCIAPALKPDNFQKLLAAFVEGVNQPLLLDFHLLEGLARLIQSAARSALKPDDLVKILNLLNTRLQETHGQSTDNLYQLTRTVSNVLDAMADSQVTGLDRETLHAPLAGSLGGLQASDDPYLLYKAAYASQALLYVPDNETPWEAAWRRTSTVIGGVAGAVSAVKAFDLKGFVEGLQNIQQGVADVVEALKIMKDGYDSLVPLVESGLSLRESLQAGFSFTRKEAWYRELRGSDILLQNGLFTEFEALVRTIPCRRHPAFQWGVCERLGQIAANPLWDPDTRQSALDFLSEIYINDTEWGQQTEVKQWIIKILLHLSDKSVRSVSAAAAKTMLIKLEKTEDAEKQALYTQCQEEAHSQYPLNVVLPLSASSSLLDRVQNKPDVEVDLRKLRRQRLQERGDTVYISPQAKPSLKASDKTLFDLKAKVNEFLDSTQKVMLLLGDSGSGKSTFNRMLEKDLWRAYTPKKKQSIPLFINLPAIDKPEQDLIPKHLRKVGFTESQIRELKERHQFVLICDGYDESQQTHNLYMSNQLNELGEWQAQMVISCRSEYIGLDYRSRFQPTERNHQAKSALFQEAVMAPFSKEKINEYIKQYVAVSRPLWQAKDYKQALEQIPHLQDLVKNPFLLTLSLEVLPRMVDVGQTFSTVRVTRVALYDQFVEQWLERGKKRLEVKTLTELEKKAFESLTDEGFTQNGIIFLKNLSAEIYQEQAGNPVVEYSHFRDQGTWKEKFFGREDDKHLLREANPLTRSGNQFRFIHRSLLEYGVARAIFEPQDGERARKVALTQASSRRGSVSSDWSFDSQAAVEAAAAAIDQPLLDSPLWKKSFVNEPSILQFLAERVQQEPLFNEQLHAVIERSKNDKEARKAAANAITILVRAGVQFNGADLQGIQIPGADLNQGVFDSAQLQGADLRKVKLRNSWLRQANLTGAKMAGTQFGELPFLQEESLVRVCTYSPDGKTCAVGLGNGTISVYETLTWKKIRTLSEHTHEVYSVVYSPDGQQIASCSFDKTVRLWNAQTGQLSHTLRKHTEPVGSVMYSPNGKQIASTGIKSQVVHLWDAHTGQHHQTLSGHTHYVLTIGYSPDSQQIASGGYDRTIRLWDVQTGQLSRTLSEHTGTVYSVVYSPDGQQIAAGGSDKTVRLWNAQTGEHRHTLSGHAREVYSVVYAPNGQQIASGSRDNTVRLWDAQTGQPTYTLSGHTSAIKSLVYASNSQQIASKDDFDKVFLWDTQTGQLSQALSGHTNEICSVAYAPNGQQIASGSRDQTVRLWDGQQGQLSHSLNGHTSGVSSVAYALQGQQIVSGSWDQTVRLWDVDTGRLTHTLIGHTSGVSSVVPSPNGQQIASTDEDNRVLLWDAQTGALSHTLSGHTGPVNSVVYAPSGKRIASASSDRTVRLWDTETGTLRQTLSGHHNMIWSVAYSPDGQQIVSGDWSAGVRLWSAQTGQLSHTLSGHTGKVYSLVYSPDSKQIASGDEDNKVHLWDAQTGHLSHTLNGHALNRNMGVHGSMVYSLSGQQLATYADDKQVLLWNTQTGQLSHTLSGHTGDVLSVKYSSNGQQLASGSRDSTVRLWDVSSGQCRMVIRAFGGAVYSVAWKEASDEEVGNSNYLVTGCADKSVRLWQIIEEGDQCNVRLSWSSTHDVLTVTNTSIQDVHGLSHANQQLLAQRGAVGKPIPSLSFKGAAKTLISMGSVASKLKLAANRTTVDTRAAQPALLN
ncbi:NB-ARC domain protein [Mycoavidus cysteinexigens]|uniref:NB-ARC domain protein n=1 Tax=Mycoavidus cysteinexigens TaxID=1553431 RepID=A0A2Z6EXC4_9BURK|nr:NACHT domain-containing protein [Mycoavidus cysteinexigens]BBE10124.1 NB-ARC domain protein [Mycoavidus cysteinexigens]GAM53529.1 hypothetical protein EBME_1992 [bacterium endosymbiont of Mortierella elongata FMR23-6]GLR00540.1 hypothetical protein GCM10007934_03510 [Mycoavidus cysteinexigens]